MEDSLASKAAIKVIDIHLKFSSLTIEEVHWKADANSTLPINRDQSIRRFRLNSLAPFISLKALPGAICDWRSLIRCIFALVRFYVVVKLSIISAVHFNFERAREQIWSASTVFEPQCINSTLSMTTTNMTDLFQTQARLEDWLYDLGTLIITYRGVTSTGYLLAASSSLCLDFLGPIEISCKKPRMTIYGFIRDKCAERRRFVRSLKSLVDDLFVCRKQVDELDGRKAYIYTPKHSLSLPLKYADAFKRLNGAFGVNYMDRWTRTASSVDDSLILFDGKRLHESIEPAHLADWWHQMLCHGSRLMTKTGFYLFFGFGYFFLNSMTIIEIARRQAYRLDSLECLVQNKTLSPHYWAPIRLAELREEWHISAYSNYRGTCSETFKLFLIEARLFMGWPQILTYLEITQILVISSFALTLYIAIYIGQYVSKTLWLYQVRLQIKKCLVSLIEIVQTDGTRESRGSTASKRCAEKKDHSMRLLTLAYLNFELFRREQNSYQLLVNFLITQMILMNVPLLIITYLTLAMLRSDDKVITFILVTYVFSFLNIYLITSARRTNMALKLMKDISRLLAYMTENSLEQSLMANLWSLQLLNYAETLSCFAPKLFGIPISFDRIVNLNVYLLTLWLFAL